MKIIKNHIVAEKMAYARGERPAVDCILCAIAEGDPQVENLRVYEGAEHFVTMNLYPYNAGHLMVVPRRHMEDVREMKMEEMQALHRMQCLTLDVLEAEYQPGGFNIGYNIGPTSGASIPHLHLQIVPRYKSEVGFFEIFSDSRIIVEHPHVTRERLRKAFAKACDKRGFTP